jgi:hypothetical protein
MSKNKPLPVTHRHTFHPTYPSPMRPTDAPALTIAMANLVRAGISFEVIAESNPGGVEADSEFHHPHTDCAAEAA